MIQYTVIAFYKFVELNNYKSIRDEFADFCEQQNIKGTILIAQEGINGTVAGTNIAIKNFIQFFQSYNEFSKLDYKLSYTTKLPFLRMKVKLKKEIVTIGQAVKPASTTGKYIEPGDWNSFIEQSDVVLIDTRNDYEVEIGKFKNAINPNLKTFREFPDYADKNLTDKKNKKIAMFCTGGIRCEKASSYLLNKGFTDVYQLKGGILKYLEKINEQNSLWEGECFVFDERVAVDNNLNKGSFEQCFGCRYPITNDDKLNGPYKKGIYCPRCYNESSATSKKRATERQKQIDLAKARGETHLGK